MRPALRLLRCSPSPASQATLMGRLARNPELSPAEAKAELRWMGDAARDTNALKGMVERRANGEPLQYILGESSPTRVQLP